MAFLLCAGSSRPAPAQLDQYPDEFLTDAELCDVFFIDPDRGWAVGDRGVIWHTEDSGRHWHLQRSPATCRLESVFFLDDRNGWIAGGESRPYTHKSTGVLLRTSDGGQHWEEVPRLALPALKRVVFLDFRRGWAVGNASDLYPAGVLCTEDGGLGWSSVPSAGGASWLTGDFSGGPQAGVVAGRNGQVSAVSGRGLEPARSPTAGLQHVRCVRLAPAVRTALDARPNPVPSNRIGWSVGDGGEIWMTADGGASWHKPLGKLPDELPSFDLRTVAVLENACWVAGSPGTRVFFTANAGQTWEAFDTGQSLPIQAMVFLDPRRGWAVGSLGTILATRDGGQTWTVQRQGGRRAAVLGVFSDPQKLPLEMFALVAGDQGHLTAVEMIGSPEHGSVPSAAATLDERVRDALSSVGVSHADTAWQFPGRDLGLRWSAPAIIGDWDRWHGGRSQERLEEHLVRKIRTWCPEIIVTQSPDLRGRDPLAHLLSQALLAAVEKAADESAYPDQILACGLPAWRVKKVFGSLGGDMGGTINVTTSQLASRLGCTLADQAQRGWQRLRSAYEPPPQTCGFRLLLSRSGDDVGRKDFFSGTTAASSDARRPLNAPPPGDLRTITQLVQQRRNIDQLLRHLAGSARGGAAWVSQVEELTRGLDQKVSGEILFELAQNLENTGRADLAAEVRDLFVRRYPAHPLCDDALTWLVQYHASSEAAWGLRRQTVPASAAASGTVTVRGATDAAAVQPAAFLSTVEAGPDPPPTADRAYLKQSIPVATLAQSSQRAAGYGQFIQGTRPSVFAAPEVRFPLASAQRVLGNRQEADSYFHFMAGSFSASPWWACAKSELWLREPTRRPPKPGAECLAASQRPHLDGRLDDAVWSQCLPICLVSPRGDDAAWPAAVLVARDAEFLFLAASCRKAAGAEYPASKPDEARPRDADLSERDRLELLLDVDRDYMTYYRLVVDHRGWAQETCLGVKAWNPTWYIAASEDDQAWTIELAIPWAELVESPPKPPDAWAVGIQRLVPGAGFQAWTQPAAPKVRPEGFGLLLFR